MTIDSSCLSPEKTSRSVVAMLFRPANLSVRTFLENTSKDAVVANRFALMLISNQTHFAGYTD